MGAGYELLEGDGVKGFTTPLATLHRFQGWADKFLTTPVNGLADKYVNVGYTTKGVGPLDTLGLTASWHEYESDRLSIDYGSELNLQLQARYRRFTGMLKYADYNAAADHAGRGARHQQAVGAAGFRLVGGRCARLHLRQCSRAVHCTARRRAAAVAGRHPHRAAREAA